MSNEKETDAVFDCMISFVANLFKVYSVDDRPSESGGVAAASGAMANGARLLNDASILASAGSLKSATALTVLSLEEFGKASLLKWNYLKLITRNIDRDLTRHEAKQSVLTAYELSVFSMEYIAKTRYDENNRENLLAALEQGNTREIFDELKAKSKNTIRDQNFLLELLKAGNIGELLTSTALARFSSADALKAQGFYTDKNYSADLREMSEMNSLTGYEVVQRMSIRLQEHVSRSFLHQVFAALWYEVHVVMRLPRLKPEDLVALTGKLMPILKSLNETQGSDRSPDTLQAAESKPKPAS